MKKAVLIFFALFFAAFAYLNLNDPDPIIWVAAYGITALLFLTAAFGRSQRMVIGSVTTILFVWMCTMIPGMIDWFRSTLVDEKVISPGDLDLIQVIDKPEDVVDAIFKHDETLGFEPLPGPPAALSAHMQTVQDAWARVVRERRITTD